MVTAFGNFKVLENALGTHFFGDIQINKKPKECHLIGLIKNQINDLGEKLEKTKVKYADSALENRLYSSRSVALETECKIQIGQINILKKILTAYEDMCEDS